MSKARPRALRGILHRFSPTRKAGKGRLVKQRSISHFLDKCDQTLFNQMLVQWDGPCRACFDLPC